MLLNAKSCCLHVFPCTFSCLIGFALQAGVITDAAGGLITLQLERGIGTSGVAVAGLPGGANGVTSTPVTGPYPRLFSVAAWTQVKQLL